MDIMPVNKDQVFISEDKTLLDVEYIYQFLHHNSYWAQGIPLDVVKQCIENSYCFGVYKNRNQIGFARVITDRATFGYLADVFIDLNHRGFGFSKLLMTYILAHPDLQGFRSWMLATKDAHTLYEQFGFMPLKAPERYMSKPNPEVYKRLAATDHRP